MKKLFFISILISFIVAACSTNTVATKDPVIPRRDATITAIPTRPLVTQLPAEVATDAQAIASGKRIYESQCARCHNPKPVSLYTETRWDGILNAMIPKTNLTFEQVQHVASYIKTNAKK